MAIRIACRSPAAQLAAVFASGRMRFSMALFLCKGLQLPRPASCLQFSVCSRVLKFKDVMYTLIGGAMVHDMLITVCNQ